MILTSHAVLRTHMWCLYIQAMSAPHTTLQYTRGSTQQSHHHCLASVPHTIRLSQQC